MGNYPLDRDSVGKPNPLLETARELGEAKRILEGVEATALSSVAQVLADVTESLSRTAKDLTDMRAAEWMTAEQARQRTGRLERAVAVRGPLLRNALVIRPRTHSVLFGVECALDE